MSEELTAGVLGGMGPEATIDFMTDVLTLTKAGRDQDHIHLVVDQNPKVPNRQQAIRDGSDDVPAVLAAMARRLEAAGADFLVMPCNSAHAFEDSIRAATSLPFVSIIDVSVEAIGEVCPGARRVAVMATDGLLEAGIYQRALEKAGFEPLLPGNSEQDRLMALIHRIKAGDKGNEVRRAMAELAALLVERGADVVLAACTEIPLVLDDSTIEGTIEVAIGEAIESDNASVPLVSSTRVLAAHTVALARGDRPLPSPEN